MSLHRLMIGGLACMAIGLAGCLPNCGDDDDNDDSTSSWDAANTGQPDAGATTQTDASVVVPTDAGGTQTDASVVVQPDAGGIPTDASVVVQPDASTLPDPDAGGGNPPDGGTVVVEDGGTGCSTDTECAANHECNQGTCQVCPAPEVPECPSGTIVEQPYGNQCLRRVCCDSGTEFIPETSTCKPVPMLDLNSCPWGTGFECHIRLISPAPGEMVTTSANFGDEFVFSVRNTGKAPVQLLHVGLTEETSPDWAIATDPMPAEIQPDDVLIIQFAFTPSSNMRAMGEFFILSDAVNGNEMRFPLEGSTLQTPCTPATVKDDCIPGQYCDESVAGICQECLSPTVPFCDNGEVVGGELAGSNRCLDFFCECYPGRVYVPGKACMLAKPCTKATESTDCAVDERCEPVCAGTDECAEADKVGQCVQHTVCTVETDCAMAQFCDQGVCEMCPYEEDPECSNGAIVEHPYGNGCIRKICCHSGSNYDPDTGTCEDIPILEVFQCTWTRVYECYIKLMADEANTTYLTSADPAVPPVFSLYNAGRAPVHIFSMGLEAGSSPDFSIVTSPLPTEIAPGETVAIQFAYTPITDERDQGWFVVESDSAYYNPIRIPVIGDTWWTPCSNDTVKSDCIQGQYCENSPPYATCAECPMPLDRMCDGGNRVAYEPEGSYLCVEFMCQCMAGDVYVQRQGCVPARPCTEATAATDCAEGEICEQVCDYAPGCLPGDAVGQCTVPRNP